MCDGAYCHTAEKSNKDNQESNSIVTKYYRLIFFCLSSSFCLSFSCFDAFPWEQQDRAGRCCCPWCRNSQTEQDEDAVLEDFCYLRLSSLSTARQFKTHAHVQKDKYTSTPMPSQIYTLWKSIIVHIEAELCIVMMMPLVCPELSHPSLYWIRPSASNTYQVSCFLSEQATATHTRPEPSWECLYQTILKIQAVQRVQGYTRLQRSHLWEPESLSVPFRAFLDTMTKWSGAALFIFQLWPGASDTPADRGKWKEGAAANGAVLYLSRDLAYPPAVWALPFECKQYGCRM